MARHDTGGSQVYVNEEQVTENGSEVVTQKSSELPKRVFQGSEVRGNIEHAEDCVESAISQVIVVEKEVLSQSENGAQDRSSETRMRPTSRSTTPRLVWRDPALLCVIH